MGIDFALSAIFLLDVGTSDNNFFFHFMIYVLFKSVVLFDVFCYIIGVFFIFQLSLYNALLFICAYQSDTLGPFRQYQTRYPKIKKLS